MFRFIKKNVYCSDWIYWIEYKCNSIKCVSMSNQEFKVRPAIMNINSNEPLFYPHSILVKKCSGSCNSINDPYANYVFLTLLKT